MDKIIKLLGGDDSMVLSEEELQSVYNFLVKADFTQLIALSSLAQSFLDSEIKRSQEDLALMLDRYEKAKEGRK